MLLCKTQIGWIAVIAFAGRAVVGCGGGEGSPRTDGSAGTGGRGGTAGTTAGSGGRDGSATGTGGTSAGTGGTDGSSAGTGGSAVDAGIPANDLGKSCASNSDCGGGLICAGAETNSFGTWGPAHGICTRACADADGGDTCGPLGGTCVDMAPSPPAVPFCMQTCTFGGMDRASKCRGRGDVACASLMDNAGVSVSVCVPVCATDADCPAGRRCDPNTGGCVTTPRAGSPIGAACTPPGDGGTNSCAGLCLAVGAGAGGTTVAARFCSQACVLGTPTGCNMAAGTTPLAGGTYGGCVLTQTGAQLGDVGFCSQECDTAANCRNQTDPGVMCDTTITAGTAIAPHGFCTW